MLEQMNIKSSPRQCTPQLAQNASGMHRETEEHRKIDDDHERRADAQRPVFAAMVSPVPRDPSSCLALCEAHREDPWSVRPASISQSPWRGSAAQSGCF